MDQNTKAIKDSLVNALNETDKIIDMFGDIFSCGELKQHEKRNFSDTADKIMSLAKEDDRSDRCYLMNLEELESSVKKCRKCKLCQQRKNVVFGEGCKTEPDLMVIGEGPGETEDLSGHPFVGKAGQYLDSWLKPISVSRQKNAYICNVVKCRPPENRTPETSEAQACLPYLKQQILLIKPRGILCLGKTASVAMTSLEGSSMASIRGKLFFFDNSIPVICTYHPAAVLRDPSLKRPVWEDLKKIAEILKLEIVTK